MCEILHEPASVLPKRVPKGPIRAVLCRSNQSIHWSYMDAPCIVVMSRVDLPPLEGGWFVLIGSP